MPNALIKNLNRQGSEFPRDVCKVFFAPSPKYSRESANSITYGFAMSMDEREARASFFACASRAVFCALCHTTAFCRADTKAFTQHLRNRSRCFFGSFTSLNQPLKVERDIPSLFSMSRTENPCRRICTAECFK